MYDEKIKFSKREIFIPFHYTKHFDINIYISRVYYRLNKGGNNKNV